MRILILIYPGFAEFEATLLGYVARCEDHKVITVAPSGIAQVTGMGGFHVAPDSPLSSVNVDDFAALVIPGGDWQEIIDLEEVSALIRSFHEAGKLIGAICSGPIQLAKAGVLDGRNYTTSLSKNHRDLFCWHRRVDSRVVVDGNIITAKGEAFVDFTFTVMERLKAYRDPSDSAQWREEFDCQCE